MRPPALGDAEWIALWMREGDRNEVLAHFDDITGAIRRAIASSQIVATAEFQHEPILVIGCAEAAPGVGAPWLLATDVANRFPGALTKLTRHYIGLFRERWPVLVNYVDERNVASVRWLDRLGFQIGEAEAMGRHGERFHPFTMGA